MIRPHLLPLLLLLFFLGHAHAAGSLTCASTPSAGRLSCDLAGLNLNDLLPSSFKAELSKLDTYPDKLVDLLPGEWSERGLLEMAGVNSEYCKNFCFPESVECVDLGILGEACTPQVCADLCVPIPAYNTLNKKPADLIEGALTVVADEIQEIVDKAVDSLELLPDFTVSLFVTTTCDPSLGLAVMFGSDVLMETSVKVSQLHEGSLEGLLGDSLVYVGTTRTLTVRIPVPLVIGLVKVEVILGGLIIEATGARVGSIFVSLDVPSESIEVFARTETLTIGTVDECGVYDTCSACTAASGCGWCSANDECASLTSSCSCSSCGGRLDSSTGCPAVSNMCWVTGASDPNSAVLSVSDYADQLIRLQVLSKAESRAVASSADVDSDGFITQSELDEYSAGSVPRPSLSRSTNNDLSVWGMIAIAAGACALMASAIVVVLGIKKPRLFSVDNCRRRAARELSKPAKVTRRSSVTFRHPATSSRRTSTASSVRR